MGNTTKKTAELREDELVELLSQLYIEPVNEANFEERFLVNFHENVVQQAVCQPARARLWDNLALFFSGLNKVKLALSSATFICFGAFTLMMTDWAVNSDSAPATASRERVRASVDSLRASSVLPSSLDTPASLQIMVTPTETQTHFYSNNSDIFHAQQRFDVAEEEAPIINDSDAVLGNELTW